MEIELKNGEKLILKVTPLLLEYIEDYEGGIEQLEKDAQGQKGINGCTRRAYATNILLYAIIASNYDKPLTYRQAVRLVKWEDIDKIINYLYKNIPNLDLQGNKEIKHRIE